MGLGTSPRRCSSKEGKSKPPANVASRFPKCLAAVSTAFAEVERLLSAGPATQAVLREELGACGSLDLIEDQAELLGALQALVGGAVQYDGQAGAPLSVRQLCGLLLGNWGNRSHSTPYLGLRRAVQVSHPDALVSQRLTIEAARPPSLSSDNQNPPVRFRFFNCIIRLACLIQLIVKLPY